MLLEKGRRGWVIKRQDESKYIAFSDLAEKNLVFLNLKKLKTCSSGGIIVGWEEDEFCHKP